ncbi:MAG: hypothetical protein GF341_07405 [candidate division Zixibacteria bacterium]|nr:hypothetical protein [candidate division Zixibacteria bacterium]
MADDREDKPMSNVAQIVAVVGSLLVPLVILGIMWAQRRGERNAQRQAMAEATKHLPIRAGDSPELPPLKWLAGEDSPTGSRVLDCRAYALGFQFVTADKETAATFAELCHSDGTELEGRSPENAWLIDVDWEFDHEEIDLLTGGMRAQSTEDLWMADVRGSRLFFRRSWTGQLVFMTNFRHIPTAGAKITRIWVTGDDPFGSQSPEYVAAYVRHLIDTHLLGVLTPFPIPPGFPRDDKKIAAFVFHSVGRRGWLAEYFSKNNRYSADDATFE